MWQWSRPPGTQPKVRLNTIITEFAWDLIAVPFLWTSLHSRHRSNTISRQEEDKGPSPNEYFQYAQFHWTGPRFSSCHKVYLRNIKNKEQRTKNKEQRTKNKEQRKTPKLILMNEYYQFMLLTPKIPQLKRYHFHTGAERRFDWERGPNTKLTCKNTRGTDHTAQMHDGCIKSRGPVPVFQLLLQLAHGSSDLKEENR